MSVDVRLVAVDWDPAVAAYRAAGMNFYWNACLARTERLVRGETSAEPAEGPGSLRDLPFVAEYHLDFSPSFVQIADYYDEGLRPHLPRELREATDALFTILALPSGQDWESDYRDRHELFLDSGRVDPLDGELPVQYALRPASVHALLVGFDALPWEEVARIADQHAESGPGPDGVDFEVFEMLIYHHLAHLRTAAGANQGVLLFVLV